MRRKFSTSLLSWFFAALLLGLSGCASNAIYEDAFPLDSGVTHTSTAVALQGPIAPADTSLHITGFFFERQKEYGLGENADAFYRYTFPLNIAGGMKLSMVSESDSWFALAAGVSLGIVASDLLINRSDSGTVDSGQRLNFLELKTPLYATVKPWEGMILNFAPNALLRFQYEKGGGIGWKPWMGLNGSMKIGKAYGMILEGSWHHLYRGEQQEYQAGMAFFRAGNFEGWPISNEGE